MRYLLFGLIAGSLATPAAAADRYAVDRSASWIHVHVGKAGLFSFAGHLHEVETSPVGGQIVADHDTLAASSVSLQLDAADLRLTGENNADDAPKIQTTMERDVLEILTHPTISFASTAVSGRETAPRHYTLKIEGALRLHGIEKAIVIPVDVQLAGDTLTAVGRAAITHDQFGLKRASGGGGTVKVANEITFDFMLVAHIEKVTAP